MLKLELLLSLFAILGWFGGIIIMCLFYGQGVFDRKISINV
jgi:hypothetical protein